MVNTSSCKRCNTIFKYIKNIRTRYICDVCKGEHNRNLQRLWEQRPDTKEKRRRKSLERLHTNMEYRARHIERKKTQQYKDRRNELAKRPKERKKMAQYIKNRKRFDTKFKLNCNVSTAIYGALKTKKNGWHWEDLVGYNLCDLITHLEKQFDQGMDWNNYGNWHIDHIIPISAFNFTNPFHNDFKRCWALKNLRPLWAEENHKKHAKLEKPFQPSLLI